LFRLFILNHHLDPQGFVLVYSITDEDSFNEMQKFKDQIEKNKRAGEKVPLALIGNKVDLEGERKVSTAQGEALAAQWSEMIGDGSEHISEVFFMETSAMVTLLPFPPSPSQSCSGG